MGHQRLGRFPKTHRWNALLTLLDDAPDDAPAITYRAAFAAERRLRALGGDPSLIHCFWLLTRLTWAARGTDFVGDVARLGLPSDPSGSIPEFISRVADAVRTDTAPNTASGHFSELASLALRRTLSETVGQYTPNLFGSSVDDLRHAFVEHATRLRFGSLAHRFFGDFLGRTLRSFLDRELAQHVGEGRGLATAEQAADLRQAVDRHARQSARIMETFAADWWSKHNWESRGEISRDEAAGFVGHALRKLRSELRREAERR